MSRIIATLATLAI